MIKQSETNRENRAETIVWGKVDLGFHMSQASAHRKLRGSVAAMEESFKLGSGCGGCVVYTLLFLCQKQRQKQRKREVTHCSGSTHWC